MLAPMDMGISWLRMRSRIIPPSKKKYMTVTTTPTTKKPGVRWVMV
jgi:hypothetical protein